MQSLCQDSRADQRSGASGRGVCGHRAIIRKGGSPERGPSVWEHYPCPEGEAPARWQRPQPSPWLRAPRVSMRCVGSYGVLAVALAVAAVLLGLPTTVALGGVVLAAVLPAVV